MLIDAGTLRSLRFRRFSRRYWQRPAVDPTTSLTIHVSLFADAEFGASTRRSEIPILVDFSAFHVTFESGGDNLHFYYHECGESEWEAGGHTSFAEIRRHNLDPAHLRAIADGIAADLIEQWGGNYCSRG